MREILFRGQELYSDNWVYGDLVTIHYPVKTLHIATNGNSQNWGKTRFTEIKPETVGQYTELKDKNGTKIFEGEILRLICGSPVAIMYIAPVYVIEFEDKVFEPFNRYNIQECEIIGNIHDNPKDVKDYCNICDDKNNCDKDELNCKVMRGE